MPRVTENLQALYVFDTGSGSTVSDVSGVGVPLDLEITDTGAVTWLPGGGLVLDSPTQVASTQPAAALVDAIALSGEVTLEAWIKPANLTQSGPARIVTLSGSPTARNVTLGQGEYSSGSDLYDVRLRTTEASGNGQPSLSSAVGSLNTELTHVVFTRDSTGTTRIYLDNALVASGSAGGDLSNWNSGYRLALGDEFGGSSRSWLGEYQLVALYGQALDAGEIAQNFTAGSGSPPPVSPPVITQSPQDATVVEGEEAVFGVQAEGTAPLAYQWQEDEGSGFTDLAGETNPELRLSSVQLGDDGRQFRVQVSNAEGSVNSETATLSVVDAIAIEPPTAVDDGYNVNEDELLSVPAQTGVLANDVDESPPNDLTAVPLTNPANGTLTSFVADGAFTYTPAPDFNGSDNFSYEAVDGGSGLSTLATVTVTVNSINDAPMAVDDDFRVDPDTPTDIDIDTLMLANDSDPDGDRLSLDSFTQPGNGELTDNNDGTLTYIPDDGFSGIDGFTYSVTDGVTPSDFADVTVTVDAVNAAPRILTGSPAFTKQVIGRNVDGTHAVVAADFDGDGDIDAAATDYVDDSIYGYENDGNGNFAEFTVDGNLNGAYPISVADVNKDGNPDLLAAGYLANTVVWYENDGNGNFTRRDVDTAAGGPHSVVTQDIDQDGDIDLLSTSQNASRVAWYENDGNNVFSRQVIDSSADKAKHAVFADVDNDGDPDVVSASYGNDQVAWYENDGNQNFTKRLIDTSADGAYFVTAEYLNEDNSIDLLVASQLDNTIAWYENNGGGNFSKRIITNSAIRARSVIAVDLDDDGDNDAVSASVNDDTVAWYENDGDGNFSARAVDVTADGAYGVFAEDTDRDGDVDVLSANNSSDEIVLHLQTKAHAASLPLGGVLIIDEDRLLTTDPDDGPESLIYTLTGKPDFGELQRDDIALSDGATFTQSDINNDRLRYVHDGLDSSSDLFNFTVNDGGESGVKPAVGSFTLIILDPADTLVELHLDEGSGTVAFDASGQGNNGLLVNGPVYEADTADNSAFSVRFDGADDYIDLGSLDANGSGLTLAVWFKADSLTGSASYSRLISKATGTAAAEHVFMLGTQGRRLRGRLRVGGATTTLLADGGSLSTEEDWRHGALTYDGTALRLYLDGVEVASTDLAGAVDQAPGVPVVVGAQPPGAGGNFFDGLIDDVRILQRALSASEIRAIAAGN